MVEDVLAVQDDWCQWHECEDSPSLQAENDAINRVLSHWDRFSGLNGGSLYVDDRMIAFSVGEKLDELSLGVHYEKGLNGFRGVYQTINCEFARHAGAGFTYINRAQDLDEEGLRQAKMTYMPWIFCVNTRCAYARPDRPERDTSVGEAPRAMYARLCLTLPAGRSAVMAVAPHPSLRAGSCLPHEAAPVDPENHGQAAVAGVGVLMTVGVPSHQGIRLSMPGRVSATAFRVSSGRVAAHAVPAFRRRLS